MENLMLSLKTALISTGIISVAILLKVSAPSITEFITSGIPSTYSLILSFLCPPYIYLLINCIIISIVASSKLQAQKPETTQHNHSPEIVFPAVKVSNEVYSSEFSTYESASARVLVTESKGAAEVVDDGDSEKLKAVMAEAPVRSESMELDSLLAEKAAGKPPVSRRFDQRKAEKAAGKPPVSRRFGQRKAVKAASEGKALRVSKPKRHDTSETTWKMIMEGRPMPLTCHLKKSGTWEQRTPKDQNALPPPLPNTMKKSDTFNECSRESSLTPSSGSGKLKRDPLLSQDDLNRRVEAFIKKFNELLVFESVMEMRDFSEL